MRSNQQSIVQPAAASRNFCFRGARLGLLLVVAWLLLPGTALQADTGVAAFERGHFYTALREWTRQANAGDARAMSNIGLLYERGYAVRQDYAEAMRWYRRAANAGLPEALHNLGMLYHNGYGVAVNHTEALRFFRDAAAQGLPDSKHMIGVAYHEGLGVAENRRVALRWFLEAAVDGYPPAQYMTAYVMLSGDAGQQNPEGAWVWGDVAAHSGMEEGLEIRDLAWLRVRGRDVSFLEERSRRCRQSGFSDCPVL